MSANSEKRVERKVRRSYLISTVSIALVLFILGAVSYVTLSAISAAEALRERVIVSVEIVDGLDKDAKKVRLAYFINTIIKGGRDQDKSYWKKAEIIFAVKGLANSYSMSNSNNDNTSNEQFVDDIEKLLK
jgi:hypothetical protein